MTKIHWFYWTIDGNDTPDFRDVFSLVEMAQKYPGSALVRAVDSENDHFWVLASGDTSEKALTSALDNKTEDKI